MNKYKVGDIVNILEDLRGDYKWGVNSDMQRYCGKSLTIESVIGEDACEMAEDECKWTWSEDMFEGLAEPDGSIGSCLRERNIVLLEDGKEMLIVGNSIRSPKGFSIGLDHYRGSDKHFSNVHDENEKFNIVAVYAPAENSNYLFDKGDLIWKNE